MTITFKLFAFFFLSSIAVNCEATKSSLSDYLYWYGLGPLTLGVLPSIKLTGIWQRCRKYEENDCIHGDGCTWTGTKCTVNGMLGIKKLVEDRIRKCGLLYKTRHDCLYSENAKHLCFWDAKADKCTTTRMRSLRYSDYDFGGNDRRNWPKTLVSPEMPGQPGQNRILSTGSDGNEQRDEGQDLDAAGAEGTTLTNSELQLNAAQDGNRDNDFEGLQSQRDAADRSQNEGEGDVLEDSQDGNSNENEQNAQSQGAVAADRSQNEGEGDASEDSQDGNSNEVQQNAQSQGADAAEVVNLNSIGTEIERQGSYVPGAAVVPTGDFVDVPLNDEPKGAFLHEWSAFDANSPTYSEMMPVSADAKSTPEIVEQPDPKSVRSRLYSFVPKFFRHKQSAGAAEETGADVLKNVKSKQAWWQHFKQH